jgi:hypothetical protein
MHPFARAVLQPPIHTEPLHDIPEFNLHNVANGNVRLTTVMVKNIPRCWSARNVLDTLEQYVPLATIDYVQVPCNLADPYSKKHPKHWAGRTHILVYRA